MLHSSLLILALTLPILPQGSDPGVDIVPAPAATQVVGEGISSDPVVLHHEGSGLRVIVPSDSRYRQGVYDDGLLGGRLESIIPQEAPADWNAVFVDFRPLGPVANGNLFIYVLPAEEVPDVGTMETVPPEVIALLGPPDHVEFHDGATFAGRPAVQFEVRSEFGEAGTLMRHLMTFHNGMRFGVTFNVAYMVEQGDGGEKMEEIVQWVEKEVTIELP